MRDMVLAPPELVCPPEILIGTITPESLGNI